MRVIFIGLIVCLASLAVSAQWLKQAVNTTASFRGLSVVSEKVAWASGTGGTVVKTSDGGATWTVMTVPGAEKLDFRDIEAFDAKTAYILSIGNGDTSRIYKTIDGGVTWNLLFKNTDEKAFFDAIACWDKNSCIAMSDPVDGTYRLASIVTHSMGNSVSVLKKNMPAAKDGEAAFAASGTCLYIAKGGVVYLVSGGSDARVFRSSDKGLNWTVADTPITKGTPGSGIFSIAMADAKNGIITGGNYEKPKESANAAAVTVDGGTTWKPVSGLRGYRSGVAFVDAKTIFAVGTSGTDISLDSGQTWTAAGDEDLNAVASKGFRSTWAVGPKGLVLKLKN